MSETLAETGLTPAQPKHTVQEMFFKFRDAIRAQETGKHTPDISDIRTFARMTYLADWKSTIDLGDQMTEVDWYVGLTAPDLVRFLPHLDQHGIAFSFSRFANNYEGKIERVFEPREMPVTPDQDRIIDHIAGIAVERSHIELKVFTESTYPMFAGNYNEPLDLLALAEAYKASPMSLRPTATT